MSKRHSDSLLREELIRTASELLVFLCYFRLV
jgi:hypothetical protein